MPTTSEEKRKKIECWQCNLKVTLGLAAAGWSLSQLQAKVVQMAIEANLCCIFRRHFTLCNMAFTFGTRASLYANQQLSGNRIDTCNRPHKSLECTHHRYRITVNISVADWLQRHSCILKDKQENMRFSDVCCSICVQSLRSTMCTETRKMKMNQRKYGKFVSANAYIRRAV